MDADRTTAGGTATEYDFARRRTRRFRATVIAVLLTGLVAGGIAGYQLVFGESAQREQRRTDQVQRAEQRMRGFVKAWTGGNWDTAGRFTDSPAATASLLESVDRNLDPRGFDVEVGDGKAVKGSVVVPFTVRMKVPRVGAFTYASKARMVRDSGRRLVAFESSVVHPELTSGQTLAVAKLSNRGAVLDRDGDELIAASLVGQVDERSGTGSSGLQKRYDEQLGGTGSAYAVAVTDRESGQALRPLRMPGTRGGQDVRTTIDSDVQRAAAKALDSAKTPGSIAAIDPSSGDILAAANSPSGFNRALVGRYPPGSTFKVVTAAALLERGLRPSDALDCPTYEWVNGYRFANQDGFTLPEGSTFLDAFARSCNTAFIGARGRLEDDALAETAAAFGIGGEWDAGVSTYDGSVPPNSDVNDKAAAMIGQGRDLASPLVMASVAATVKSGGFVQPRLVPEAVEHPYRAPSNLDTRVIRDLRSMMRTVVTGGAGHALRSLPGKPHAKTGTAEYGDERPPRTHAWMIGYQDNSEIAWAVLLEGGGSGGADAGPIAAAFLKRLTAR